MRPMGKIFHLDPPEKALQQEVHDALRLESNRDRSIGRYHN
jgi:hypothetical protein